MVAKIPIRHRARASKLRVIAVCGSIALVLAAGGVALGSGSPTPRDAASPGQFGRPDTAASPRPKYCPKGDETGFDARKLIGRGIRSAFKTAKTHDCSVRVVRRNGEDLAITEDFSYSRIDIAVRAGRVVGIVGIF